MNENNVHIFVSSKLNNKTKGQMKFYKHKELNIYCMNTDTGSVVVTRGEIHVNNFSYGDHANYTECSKDEFFKALFAVKSALYKELSKI